MKETDKVICQDCSWKGTFKDLLVAQNPFDETESIQGCPNCKAINMTRLVCDEHGCWLEAGCGFNTEDGYRNTCHKHYDNALPR